MEPTTTNNSDDTITPNTDTNTSTPTTTTKYGWTRINYKGPYFHDNRRLLKHRAKNCVCPTCIRELKKLPPTETHEEYITAIKTNVEEREIKRAKRTAKKAVKDGKQATIQNFFKRPKKSSATTNQRK